MAASDTCEYVFTRRDAAELVADVDADIWRTILDDRGIDGDRWTCPHEALEDGRCVFHRPLDDRPEVDRVAALEEALASVEAPAAEGGSRRNQFVGATFGALDLGALEIDLPEDVTMGLDLLGATFAGPVEARDCTLPRVGLSACQFDAVVTVEDVTVEGLFTFREAEFAEQLWVTAVDVDDALYLRDATLAAGAEIADLTVTDGLYCQGLETDAELSFAGLTVTDTFGCSEMTAADTVRITDSRLEGPTYLSYGDFAAGAELTDLTVTDALYCKGLETDAELSFEDLVVTDTLGCSRMTAADTVRITDSRLEGASYLSYGDLESLVIDGCEFGGEVSMYDTTFSGEVQLRRTTFDPDPLEDDDQLPIRFEGIDAEAKFWIYHCDFGGAVNFKFMDIHDYFIISGEEYDDADIDRVWFREGAAFNESTFQSGIGMAATVFEGNVDMFLVRTNAPSEMRPVRIEGVLNCLQATLRDTDFKGSEIHRARFKQADLTASDFTGVALVGADFERAMLSRVVFDGADLRGANFDGAFYRDIRINDETRLLHPPIDPLGASSRVPLILRKAIPLVPFADSYCGADPDFTRPAEYADRDDLYWPHDAATTDDGELDVAALEDEAKTVYRTIENIASDHSRSRLESWAFIRGQDIRRRQLSRNERPLFGFKLRSWFTRLQHDVFLYGESFARIVAVSLGIILVWGLVYPLFGWTGTLGPDGNLTPLTYGRVLEEPILLWRSVYHSAMMFATGNQYGGVRAMTPAAEFVTSVEALLGPTMLALLVFVLGRRAAR